MCLPKSMGGLGFRDVKAFNTVLLAKQAWKVIQSPHSLVSRVLKSKYFPRSDFLRAKLGCNPSYVWRSILSAKHVLRDGGVWRIGDGWDINVWNQSWLPHRPRGRLVDPAPEHMSFTRVSEFIDPQSSTWDVPRVLSSFIEADATDILKIRIPEVSCGDQLCWPSECFGEYSVRSGYRWIKELDALELSTKHLYNAIWGCNLPPKIKHFAWRVCKGILPTSQALFNKLILASPCCPICSRSDEDLSHGLVWCDRAKATWLGMNLTSTPLSIAHPNCVLEWLISQVSKHDMATFEKGTVIMWSIWSARNIQVFEGNIQLAVDVKFMVERSFKNWHNGLLVKKNVSRTEKQNWKPPDAGFLKLNCDASYKGERGGGIGAIVRNEFRNVLGALAAPHDHCASVKETEAVAIKEGMLLARNMGIQKLIIESDASEVVLEINGQQPSLSLHGHIIRDIKQLALSFCQCSFVFIPRHCNAVADRLASVGSSLPNPVYWYDETPAYISDVILLDQ